MPWSNNGLIVGIGVKSGNRNFEGRVHNNVKASYLASPPLVVAYALAGTLDIDLETDADRHRTSDGKPVYLRDIWPSNHEVQRSRAEPPSPRTCSAAKLRRRVRGSLALERHRQSPSDERDLTPGRPTPPTCSSPPFFEGIKPEPSEAIAADQWGTLCCSSWATRSPRTTSRPAAVLRRARRPGGHSYLQARAWRRRTSTPYGSRRGNHEVMMRGTFANVRIRNQVAPGTEGGCHHPLPHR